MKRLIVPDHGVMIQQHCHGRKALAAAAAHLPAAHPQRVQAALLAYTHAFALQLSGPQGWAVAALLDAHSTMPLHSSICSPMRALPQAV